MLPDKKKNPIAQARVFQRLIDKSELTVTQVAKRIHRSPSYVSNTLRLLSLPEALQDALISGLIMAGHGRALAAISDKRAMITAYKEILKKDGSVRMAEALARKMKKKKVRHLKIKKGISRALGGAKVELSRSRVQSRIVITLKGGYEKTEPHLRKIYQRLTKPNLVKGQ